MNQVPSRRMERKFRFGKGFESRHREQRFADVSLHLQTTHIILDMVSKGKAQKSRWWCSEALKCEVRREKKTGAVFMEIDCSVTFWKFKSARYSFRYVQRKNITVFFAWLDTRSIFLSMLINPDYNFTGSGFTQEWTSGNACEEMSQFS